MNGAWKPSDVRISGAAGRTRPRGSARNPGLLELTLQTRRNC